MLDSFFKLSAQGTNLRTEAVAMPLTFSISTGIGLGFIAYVAIKLLSGRTRNASPAMLALAAVFAVKFAVT